MRHTQSQFHSFCVGNTNYYVPISNPSAINSEGESVFYKPRHIVEKANSLNFLVLYVTNSCNLACKYCFAAKSSTMKPLNMPLGTAHRAVDFLFKTPASKVAIRFFGGEPLLNFELIKEVVHYAENLSVKTNKKISFSIFTNAVLLSQKYAFFLKEHDFTTYVSIGASERSHNQLRPLKTEGNSFDMTVKNVEKLLKLMPYKVVVRVILNPNEQEISLHKTLDFLTKKIGFVFVSFEVPWVEASSPFSLNTSSLEWIKEEFSVLSDLYIKRFLRKDFSWLGFHQFGNKLRLLVDEDKPLDTHSCGAGNEMLAISTDGFIYPCQSFVGMKSFELGNVEEGLINKKLYETFYYYSAETVPICKTCWARFLCETRCPFDSLLFSHNMYIPNHFRCSLERHINERALYIYTTIKQKNPRLLSSVFRWLTERGTKKLGVW